MPCDRKFGRKIINCCCHRTSYFCGKSDNAVPDGGDGDPGGSGRLFTCLFSSFLVRSPVARQQPDAAAAAAAAVPWRARHRQKAAAVSGQGFLSRSCAVLLQPQQQQQQQ